jgi:hypothetical protein
MVMESHLGMQSRSPATEERKLYMKHSRRINSLLSVCASLALAACAGEIDGATFGETPALADQSSPVHHGSETQPTAPTGTSSGDATASRDTETQTPVPSEPPVAPPPVQPAEPVAPVVPLASILWTDEIQTSDNGLFGFSQFQLERPIGSAVGGSDQVNLTRVPNPIGAGFALKHVATFDNNGGSRSQACIYSFANKSFEQQVKSQEGIWIAQEWYFPEPLSAGSPLDSSPWMNLWDFHSVGAGDRWHTQPGLQLAEDGSMRVKWSWSAQNPETGWSQIDLPVGEWFDVEMHYVWSSSGTTISLWINGDLALQQHGVITKGSTHNSVETYSKFYGSANGGPSWSPSPSVKYMRNVRMAGERIWR